MVSVFVESLDLCRSSYFRGWFWTRSSVQGHPSDDSKKDGFGRVHLSKAIHPRIYDHDSNRRVEVRPSLLPSLVPALV